ncbi:MAG: hypothetical protein AB1405_07740 [Bdellovibrionota bacterium]
MVTKQYAIVMSIKPVYANAIYSRLKKYEFRRVRMNAKSGDLVLIYETAPVSMLTGGFVIGTVSYLQNMSELRALLGRNEITQDIVFYLRGAKQITALEVRSCFRWEKPLQFSQLFPGRAVPQSYMREGFTHGHFCNSVT